MNTYLRDHKGQLLGWTKPSGNLLYMFNHQGELLGWFDVPKNLTFNRKGERFGTGNQVTRLLSV